ncbi:MAG: hypothetical protein ABJA67_06740 [Chthonomonadales bacterium]
MSTSGWVGVDLDGTLAVYEGSGHNFIGAPVPLMVARVKAWLAEGVEVRIVTARANILSYLSHADFMSDMQEIRNWCKEHVGQELQITCSKDFGMVEIWDDRAVGVEMNTGRRLDGKE